MRNSAPSSCGWLWFHRLSLLALVGAMAATAGCSPESTVAEESDQQPELPTIEAEVLTIEPQTWPTIIRSQGSLVADEQAVVGAKVAGRVATVHVDIGDFVRAGDPLVTLDQEDFRLRVEQAEAQLLQARAAVGLKEDAPVESLSPENSPPVRQEKALWQESESILQRTATLRRQNAISEGEYDRAAAAERVAEARYAAALNGVREKIAMIHVRQVELNLARQQLADATIRAPLDGYVQQRSAAPGTYVAVGQTIATLVRTDPLRFRGTIPERYAQQLAVGQSVRMRIESVPEPREAQITRVSPALDLTSRALSFEADVENHDYELRSGLFVEAEVVIAPEARALVVPHSAIVQFAGAEKVWKVVDGVAQEHEILAGADREEGREVLQGLSPGDVILRDAGQGRIARVVPASATDS